MRAGLLASLATAIFVALAGFASGEAAPVLSAAKGLPVEKIAIETKSGPHMFSMEIAADPEAQERGLMFRKTMAPNAGMLFDFHEPHTVVFWMKNTILPLDMLFVDSAGTISSIRANAVPYSEAQIPSVEPVQVVIELNAGRAKALGIEPGAKVHAAAFGNALTLPPPH